MKFIAFTIIAENYLPFALVLAESYTAHHKDHSFIIFTLGKINKEHYINETTSIIDINEIEVDDLEYMKVYYNITELSTAVKPYVFRHIMEKYDCDTATYIDPDILVFSRFEELEDVMNLDTTSIVLTPHAISPSDMDGTPNDITLLKHGVYNLGFVSVKNNSDGRRMLDWWATRLKDYAFADTSGGLFTDQKWMDLTPSYFEGVVILKNVGYNVAYWNLHERTIYEEDFLYKVNETIPLRFFHYSGIDIEDPRYVSKYQNRYSLDSRPDIKNLFMHYVTLVKSKNYFSRGGLSKELTHPLGDNYLTDLQRKLYYQVYSTNKAKDRNSINSLFWHLKKQLQLDGDITIKTKSKQRIDEAEFIYDNYRRELFIMSFLFKSALRILGESKYEALLRFLHYTSNTRMQSLVLTDIHQKRKKNTGSVVEKP